MNHGPGEFKRRWKELAAAFLKLPGAAATQLGIFIGHQRAGWGGGLIAGLCFILPALKGSSQFAIAAGAAALFAFTPVGIVSTLLLAGSAGVAIYHSRGWGLRAALVLLFLTGAYHWTAPSPTALGISMGTAGGAEAPLPDLWDIGTFFFKVGAFTFGGGITVLAFVQDQVVNQLQWLTPREFLDGLAMGQLTPGPLLMLAAYVGYQLHGVAGAVVGATAIFAPAFILMLSVVPIINRVREFAWIKAAMRAVGAAVIGVISVSLVQMAPHAAPDAFTSTLALLTIAALLIWKPGPLPVMLGGALAGAAYRVGPFQRLKELL